MRLAPSPEALLRSPRALLEDECGRLGIAPTERFWQSLLPMALTALDGRLLCVNAALGEYLGVDPASLLGTPAQSVVEVADVCALIDDLASGAVSGAQLETRIPRSDASDLHAAMTWSAVRGPDDRPWYLSVVLVDVTSRVAAEQALRESEARLRAILDTAQEGVWAAGPRGEALFANAKMADILGLPLEQVHSGGALARLDPADADLVARSLLERTQRGVERYEVSYAHPDGSQRVLAVTASPLPSDDGDGSLALVSDVTDARRVEEQLRVAALHDALTGLPNRTLLGDRISQAAKRSGDPRYRGTCVLLVGLDGFRRLNAEHGHGAGDAVLVEVAQRLSAVARVQDTVARYLGDEFALVCEDVDAEEGRRLAEAVREALAEELVVDGTAVQVDASIGIALSPPSPSDALLRHADDALRVAKAHGRGRVHVTDRAVLPQSGQPVALAADLRGAIAADELALHYQPVVELGSGRVVGMEALARWDHPTLGSLSPAHFVAVAEQNGLAGELDRWVLGRACADAAALHRDGALPPTTWVSVNVSAGNLAGTDLRETALAAAHAARLAPEAVVLEITETAVMLDVDASVECLLALRAHGFGVAVDDFGTGYSSLAYLKRLPVTNLKIDRSFVEDLCVDQDAAAIVASIVDLARAIGVVATAEGVEEDEQARRLLAFGCHAGQGRLWGDAASPDALRADCARWLGGFGRRGRRDRAPAPERPVRSAVQAEHGLSRLLELHASGASHATIAAALTKEGFRTPTGLRWHRTTVARAVASHAYPSRAAGQAS